MNRKDFMKSAAGALAAAVAMNARRAQAARRTGVDKPNIIYILADDLGYQELGCYGQKTIRTPNIDRIAAEGIRFQQHYSGSPVCAPSRCTLMTGKHTGHAFIRDNGNPPDRRNPDDSLFFPGQNPIPPSEMTIAEMLKAHGYATGGMGKWGLGYEGSTGDPNKQGFDLFYGYLCQVHAHNHYPRYLWRNGKREFLKGNDRTLNGEIHSQERFVDVAKEFIRENKDQPFFLYLPFAIPHLSIQVPEEFLNEYKDKIEEAEYTHRGYLQHPYPRAGYAAMVTFMDHGVGQIMNLVKELGLDEKTIILFASDNGPTYDRLGGSDSEYFESAGRFKGLKGSVYEGGIRVPLVARWPGHIHPGQVSDHPSAFWDMMATFADIAGTRAPEDTDGISIAPTLLGKGEQKRHAYLYWEFPSYGGQQAVRLGDWKGVRMNIFKGNRVIELYDLKTDPGETSDVAADHPEIVKRIEDIMQHGRTDSTLFPLFRDPPTPRSARAISPARPDALPKDQWRLVRVDSENTSNGKVGSAAIDGNPDTWWHSKFSGGADPLPHEIVVDLGDACIIHGFVYLPRTDGGRNGMIGAYEFFVSERLDDWGVPVVSGVFANEKKGQVVEFPRQKGRYVRLRALSELNGRPFTSIAELDVLGKR